jgi:hypothetical protein
MCVPTHVASLALFKVIIRMACRTVRLSVPILCLLFASQVITICSLCASASIVLLHVLFLLSVS